MKVTIDLKSDNSERVHYNSPDFPAYIRKGLLSHFHNYAAASHWHDDVEFIAILSGHMQYNINGDIVTLRSGEGIFVNARQLHFGFSETHTECEFICLLLHPMLLCASQYVEQTFVAPVIINDAFPYLLLQEAEPEGKAMLAAIRQIYDDRESPLSALRVQSLFFQIWSGLYEQMPKAHKQPAKQYIQLSLLKDMIGYIQKHYREKIRLEDIAAAGSVGKSSCCAIFQSYLHQTPMSYLTDYRLKKSVDLMFSSDMTITEISYAVGFTGASYYAETFRKYFGASPTVYRLRHAGSRMPQPDDLNPHEVDRALSLYGDGAIKAVMG